MEPPKCPVSTAGVSCNGGAAAAPGAVGRVYANTAESASGTLFLPEDNYFFYLKSSCFAQPVFFLFVFVCVLASLRLLVLFFKRWQTLSPYFAELQDERTFFFGNGVHTCVLLANEPQRFSVKGH